jgi:hypothetical protein
MSALTPKADIRGNGGNVRRVPKADLARSQFIENRINKAEAPAFKAGASVCWRD